MVVMKKMIVAAMWLMALAACKQTAVEQKNAQFEQQRDSLNRVIAQKDIEINDMVGTLNDIEEGFRAINEAEQRVTVAREGEGSTAAVRIRENMQYIAEQMEQNRELINKLRTQGTAGSSLPPPPLWPLANQTAPGRSGFQGCADSGADHRDFGADHPCQLAESGDNTEITDHQCTR